MTGQAPKRTTCRGLVGAAALAGLLLPVLLLLSVQAADAAVQRHLLAIYDSAHEPQPSQTLVHYRAEMPLNHLGYIVDYHDIRTTPLPQAQQMARYRGVITWFTYELERPTEYLQWAAMTAESGVRFIILGTFGGNATAVNVRLLNRVLAPMGIRYTSDHVTVTAGATIVRMDPAMIGFERPLDPLLPGFPIIETASAEARVALEARAAPIHGGASSALVTTGPGGALAIPGFDIYYDGVLERSRWLVNPFELFRRALGETIFPIPDTTTVSGRRLYFSHVDGDGWNNLAEMERYRTPPVTSAEVMLRELIAPYPDLPVSVGLVAGDLDPVLGGGEEAAELARQIYDLPQVEVASHTNTHPFFWKFYEDYDRDAELRMLPEGSGDAAPAGPFGRVAAILGLAEGQSEEELQRARYTPHGLDMPRAYLRDPFDLALEVDDAVHQTEALAPPGKHAALYQWSGDTRPFAAAIRATRRAALRNINGGDTRFDDEYPSVGYVAALSRVVGSERQIYAVNSNENTYTNEWTDHFHGYQSLSETLRRTELPRRLKGANVYYHTFSAEKDASLSAIRTHLEWARHSALAPIRASRYAAIADGFFSTVIEEAGPMRWRVSARDGLQTVRFDEADALDVDLERSHGVIGRTRHAGSLYIALDEMVEDATVALRAADAAAQPAASLRGGRWLVSHLERSPCGVRHWSQGYGKGEFTWDGFAPGRYRITAHRAGDVVWSGLATASGHGQLSFVIDADAIDILDVAVLNTAGGCRADPKER